MTKAPKTAVGDVVEGGEGDDYDWGRVIDTDEDRLLVAWQSGVRTWTPRSTVRLKGSVPQ